MPADDRVRKLFPYVVAAVLAVVLGLRVLGGSAAGDEPAIALDGPGTKPAHARHADGRIWVHVAGAVRRPGLYRVRADARAGLAVDAAGGPARRADLRAI